MLLGLAACRMGAAGDHLPTQNPTPLNAAAATQQPVNSHPKSQDPSSQQPTLQRPATLDYAALGLPPDGRTRVEDELAIPKLSAAEAGEFLDDPRALFIDIRQAHEYRHAHIPGAWRIQAQAEDGLLATLPQGRILIVYCACHSEQASARSAVILRALGHRTVYALRGGLPAWREAGLPVEEGPEPERRREP